TSWPTVPRPRRPPSPRCSPTPAAATRWGARARPSCARPTTGTRCSRASRASCGRWPVRDIVVFTLFVVLLPVCLLRPWLGLMVFSWLAYNRTQDLTWGFARGLPISELVAIAFIVGWLIWEYRPLISRDPRLKAMVALLTVIGISIACKTFRYEV